MASETPEQRAQWIVDLWDQQPRAVRAQAIKAVIEKSHAAEDKAGKLRNYARALEAQSLLSPEAIAAMREQHDVTDLLPD